MINTDYSVWRVAVVAALCTFFGTTPLAAAPSEPLLQSDFETTADQTAWQYKKTEVTTAQAHSGQAAAQLGSDGSGWGQMTRYVSNLQPNTTYKLTFWLASTGSSIVYVDMRARAGSHVRQRIDVDTQWKAHSVEFTTRKYQHRVRIQFWGEPTLKEQAQGDMTYVDDVTFSAINTNTESGDVTPGDAIGVMRVGHEFKAPTPLSTESILILGTPGSNEADAGVAMVKPNDEGKLVAGFQEWNYLDQQHAQEEIPWIAAKPGRYTNEGGAIAEVGIIELKDEDSRPGKRGIEWTNHQFAEKFPGKPILLLTPQTQNEADTYTVVAKNVRKKGFKAAIYEEEASDHLHAAEKVGYIALYSPKKEGSIDLGFGDVPFKVGYTHLGHKAKNIFKQPLYLQEEQSKDQETRHTKELIAVLGVEKRIFAQAISGKGANAFTPRIKGEEKLSLSGLKADTITQDSVALSWEPATGKGAVAVTQYQVLRDDIEIAKQAETRYTDTGLPFNTAFTYQVKALDEQGNVLAQTQKYEVTTKDKEEEVTPPGTPKNLKVTLNDKYAELSWEAPEQGDVSTYTIRRNGNVVGTSTETRFTDKNTTPGQQYSYTVAAKNAQGESPAATVSITIPNDDDEDDDKDGNGDSNGDSKGDGNGDGDGDSDGDGDGDGEGEGNDTQPPSTPQPSVQATTATTVSISWKAATDNVAVVGYEVFRTDTRIADDAPRVKIADTTGTTYQDSNLVSNNGYYYQVRAYDAAGNRSEFGIVRADTLKPEDKEAPSVPQGLTADGDVENQVVRLSWDNATDNVAVTGYQLFRNGNEITTTASNGYTDNNVELGQEYQYQVRAFDKAGNVSKASMAATVKLEDEQSDLPVTGKTLAETCFGCHGTDGQSDGPSIPTLAGMDKNYFARAMLAYQSKERHSTMMGRIAGAYSEEEINKMGEYFAAQNFTPAKQTVQLKRVAKGQELHQSNGCNVCHGQDGTDHLNGILAGQWMPYLLDTINDYAEGRNKDGNVNMNERLASMSAADREALVHFYGSFGSDTKAPDAPADLTVAESTETSITLTWSDADDNIRVARYEIQRNGKPIDTTELNTYTDTGLDPQTQYDYKVYAIDEVGNRSATAASTSGSTKGKPSTGAVGDPVRGNQIWEDRFCSACHAGSASDLAKAVSTDATEFKQKLDAAIERVTMSFLQNMTEQERLDVSAYVTGTSALTLPKALSSPVTVQASEANSSTEPMSFLQKIKAKLESFYKGE